MLSLVIDRSFNLGQLHMTTLNVSLKLCDIELKLPK